MNSSVCIVIHWQALNYSVWASVDWEATVLPFVHIYLADIGMIETPSCLRWSRICVFDIQFSLIYPIGELFPVTN